ncbi:MAG: tRNA dihydrouridine(20/20a) synthase DusA [Methylococcales symbiont of Hymedesmia sp. n. MRB-2018]|nr:MAG: tRNA dihydrouridine(20/20a) synthase DusA [Methylococcales symbiont of Hymedesmia sp. n. MRB-2018]KAF3983999.1 MAG: tRNA dihydrouridine(20/20a) synthase DusA [Methylococcales symbiont of Hymedesmia sp. n. MRB-2018]
MLNWTDRHCRYFHRLLTHKSLLYTEMVTTGALLHGSSQRFLAFNPAENPLAFQLGGSQPKELASCAKMIEDFSYDAINLNIGCPSDRVQNGRFGACLMTDPALVADCIDAMRQVVSMPVTVKSRIGIDEQDSYQQLLDFIGTVANAGCKTFIIHARKAWLKGLSPKQNREIPPLRYDLVYQIKKDLPVLEIILNGGVTSLQSAQDILQHVDGVMVGREAYHNPYVLAEVDNNLYQTPTKIKTRDEVVMALIPYINKHIADGGRLHNVTRHILGLFHGVAGARKWRSYLSENAGKKDADEGVVLEALKHVQL